MIRRNLLKSILFILCLFSSSSWSQSKGMVSYDSPYTVEETEQRLINVLNSKGFKVFAQINHSEGAKAVNIKLPEIRVVVFGKPQVGSKLMQCNPSVAIDLPQKMLIWEDEGKVKLAYNSPRFLQKRHQLQACETILKKINNALNKIAKKVINKNK